MADFVTRYPGDAGRAAFDGARIAGVDRRGAPYDVSPVSFTEMCRLLDVSEPTLRKDMVEPGFPVLEGGSNGVAYKLDPVAVRDWRADREDRRREAEEERAREIEDMRQTLFGGESLIPADVPAVTAKERQQWIETEYRATQLAKQRGELVKAADVEACLRIALGEFARECDQLPDRIARDLGLSREQAAAIRERVEAVRGRLVTTLGSPAAYQVMHAA